jgi:hypothetical protein
MLGCSDYLKPDFAINDNPMLPPPGPIAVAENSGAADIHLGMDRQAVESTLGGAVDTSSAVKFYKKEDIRYGIHYLSGKVTGIEVYCSRFIAITAGGDTGIGYTATRDQMTAFYGQPEREEPSLWRYDSRGIAFFYDAQTLRVTGAYVYPATVTTTPTLSLRYLRTAGCVDNDGDQYCSSLDVEYDVDISFGSDSFVAVCFVRQQPDTAWQVAQIDTFAIVGASAADSVTVRLTGLPHGTFDFHIEAGSMNFWLVVDTTLYGIKLESPGEDG